MNKVRFAMKMRERSGWDFDVTRELFVSNRSSGCSKGFVRESRKLNSDIE